MDQDANFISTKLSVAIIARNEEGVIDECIASVKGADEIIVVDTGSEDGTVARAQELGALTHTFSWNDNFSDAYNFANSHCTYPWILSIDADERLLTSMIEVKKHLKEIDHAYSDVKVEYDASWHYAPKLFRNNEFVNWQGPVHKFLNVWDRWNKGPVHLYAFRSRSHSTDPDRTLRMLLDTMPKDLNPRYLFYTGMEYAVRQKWDEALKWFNEFRSRPYKRCYKAEAELMVGKIYLQKQQYIDARTHVIRAYELNSEFAEASDVLAYMSHGNERREWLTRRDRATGDNVLFYRKGKWLY